MKRSLWLLPLLVLLPTGAAAAVRLEVDRVDAEPGERVSVAVRLAIDAGEPAATVGNDLALDPRFLRVAVLPDGAADCAVEPDVPHFLSAFFLQPPECDPAAGACTGVRALVVLFALDRPPLEPRVLYRCNVEVDAGTPPEEYPLANTRASYSTAEGDEGPVAAIDGAVVVGRDRIPTRTPTPPEPTPRRTPPVLDPRCAGDCDGSGEIDEGEPRALLAAIFDGDRLDSCDGSPTGVALRAAAADLLRALRARGRGCTGRPTRTPTRTATATATATAVPPDTATATITLTPTTTRTPTVTRTPSWTRTPRPSSTPTRTRARTPSTTPTATRVPRTATPTPAFGPQVNWAGVARGDGRLLEPAGESDGVPLYQLASGTGFHLVFEGRPGMSLSPIGRTTYAPDELPDLQVLVDRPLGDGSARVCSGGVPGFASPGFDGSDAEVDAMNDLGCHFEVTTCVLFGDGRRGFVAPQSTIQFCGLIGAAQRFAHGETTVSVRLRDRAGVTGEIARIVVRIGD